MKLNMAIAALCALTACAAPHTPQTGVGFSNPDTFQSGAPVQNVPIARPEQTSTLPFFSEVSRQYARGGGPTSERSAAMDAFRARDSFWDKGDSELISLGKFRLKLRQVRVDTHDFIVAEHASNTIGATRFNLTSKTRQAAQARTACTVENDVYFVRNGYEAGMVFPLSC